VSEEQTEKGLTLKVSWPTLARAQAKSVSEEQTGKGLTLKVNPKFSLKFFEQPQRNPYT
jgi:hypothetical protein